MLKKSKFYLVMAAILVSVTTVGTIALAESEKPTCDMAVTAYSQYIWRGYELSQDSIVIFPEMSVSYKGFAATIWADLDLDYAGETISNRSELLETDLVLSYGNSVGMLNYAVGWIYYDFDGGEDQEVYVTLGLDTILSPEINIYRGIQSVDSWYVTFGLSHSFDLKNGWSVDLGGVVGYYEIADGDLDGGDYSAMHDATISAGLNIPLNDWATLTPSINYTFALSGDAEDLLDDASFDGSDSDFIYGGVTLAVSF